MPTPKCVQPLRLPRNRTWTWRRCRVPSTLRWWTVTSIVMEPNRFDLPLLSPPFLTLLVAVCPRALSCTPESSCFRDVKSYLLDLHDYMFAALPQSTTKFYIYRHIWLYKWCTLLLFGPICSINFLFLLDRHKPPSIDQPKWCFSHWIRFRVSSLYYKIVRIRYYTTHALGRVDASMYGKHRFFSFFSS